MCTASGHSLPPRWLTVQDNTPPDQYLFPRISSKKSKFSRGEVLKTSEVEKETFRKRNSDRAAATTAGRGFAYSHRTVLRPGYCLVTPNWEYLLSTPVYSAELDYKFFQRRLPTFWYFPSAPNPVFWFNLYAVNPIVYCKGKCRKQFEELHSWGRQEKALIYSAMLSILGKPTTIYHLLTMCQAVQVTTEQLPKL